MTDADLEDAIKNQQLRMLVAIAKVARTRSKVDLGIYLAGCVGGIAQFLCEDQGWAKAYEFFQQYADDLIMHNPEVRR